MSSYTIIVPDANVLHRVCGTNDSNLRLIEAFLNSPVFACGNELSIECDDRETEEQFKFIIDRILDEFSVSGNSFSDRELIEQVLNFNHPCSDITVPGGIKKIFPRTKGQIELLNAMRKNDMVFALGPAGSGKTFLCVAEALRLLLCHKVRSIILTRPVVEAGESLGYLPGDLEDKINPYIKPLYDAINAILPRDTVKKMTENGIIEVAPLAYMRGRTLNDSVIILDEAQNTTKEQMKMFLTRMGENSKMFITGDVTQIDLPKKVPSGLVHAANVLRNVSEIAIVELSTEDIVRNNLVKKIIQAYKDEEREE